MPKEDLQKQINEMEKRLKMLETSTKVVDHFHNGFDSSRISYGNVSNREIWISHTIVGADAATAANYGVFFINEIGACYLSSFYEVHQTAGSDAGAVTVTLERLSGTDAPDSGDAMLASALSLKSTANTIQTGSITGTSSNRTLAIGDRLCLDDSGTLTAVANVTVFVKLVFST